ncbi:hypothetical protein FEM48_Zijuj03G0122700 [Ziziphus jujuba var. spinosa]|uniref:Bifunctional inhibitor/plant lipid transfer protein/seed storage helical domain-containing protein n=1 Tax=Ziziphus jujuba var. spinosa TaxID=714518 RepID=A0A978VQ93_ZIZJJ|nr:hypothetical protein FEM48_Zijuj03G0122700 [Ziziphus jujuba var. spinosa]
MVVVVLGNFEEVPILGIKGDDTSPSQCKEEKDLLVTECKPMLFGSNPSGSCCKRIRVTHVECVCPLENTRIASLINVKRIMKQIEGCGRTLPHHFKCGSQSLSHSF